MASEYLNRKFSDWTREDALQAIRDQVLADVGSEAAYEANRLYTEEGDHWQEGETWPMTHSDAEVRVRIKAAAELIFCSVDAVETCVQRQVAALLDHEPDITIAPLKPAGAEGAPSEEQERKARAMRAFLSAWWDRVQLWERLKESARRAAWAKRGPLRLRFLPSALVASGGGDQARTTLASGLTFAAALERIHLSAPLPDSALLYTDPETQEKASLITYEEDGKTVAEIWYLEGDKAVRRILRESGLPETNELEGVRLPVCEVRGPLLLTDSVRRQQARRDYYETLLTRGTEAFGFRERYTTNAMPAGVWSKTRPADGVYLDTRRDDSGATEYLLPLPRILGPGVLTEVQGREYDAGEGKKGLATPGVVVVEPADPDYAIKSCRHAQFTLLESCHQLHVLEGDKAVSGYSKRQSRADFEKHVKSYKGSTEAAIAEVLTSAIAGALLMTGQGDEMRGFLDEYRISVTLKIDTGPLSADEIETEALLAEKLLKARSNAMAAAGVEDVDAENAAILADPIQRLSLRKTEGEVFTLWSGGGNLEAGIEASGIDGALAKAARRTDFGVEP